ncbi:MULTISPECIES: BT4734/BF3469 family protein [Parabacteroides]|uniref:BT4734/BF3469 family protein n=1 Tax=Parabacteroides sp. TaxID=1869337 RepID=UPI003FEDD7CE
MKITQLRGDLTAFRNLELSIVLNAMKTENSRKPVSTLRQDVPYLTPQTKSLAAEKIPVVLFGATLKRDVEKVGVVSYTGLVLLSIGNLIGKAEAAGVRRRVAGFPQTLACFIGSSGRSIKVVIPFTLPDGLLPETEEQIRFFHAHAYLRASRYYEAQLQLPVECKGEGLPAPEQGCRLSYDPDLYYNPDALPIRMEQLLQMPVPATTREVHNAEKDPLRRMAPGYERYKRISLLYETSLAETFRQVGPEDGAVEERKRFMVHLARKCCQSAIPEEDAVRFALVHPFGKEREMELRATFGNVFRKEKHCSVRPCMPRRMLVAMQMEEFMTRRYDLRFNRMKGCKEYRERHSLFIDYRPVTAEIVKSICFEAQLEGISAIEYDVQRYVDSRRIPHFWPVEEYLYDLPGWDGQERIRTLADCVPCKNGEWRDFFYLWFISMVAHWLQMDREHANSTSPLLVGPQGCRKSTFCQNLLPPELRPYYIDGIDLGSRKDAELALNRFALINLDEFDSIPASRQPYLKNLLQKPKVTLRKPYGESMEEMRRFASFIATSNTFSLLADTSGNRRFIGVEVEGMIRIEPLDYPQLYAEAVTALREGARFLFTPEEEVRLNLSNRAFEKHPLLEELFLYYYRMPEEGEACEPLSAPEILMSISKQSKTDLSETKLELFGRLMLKHKVQKKVKMDRKYYYVIPVER